MSGRALPGSVRVYEAAAHAGVPTSVMFTYLRGLGAHVMSPSSAIPPVLAALAVEHFTADVVSETTTENGARA